MLICEAWVGCWLGSIARDYVPAKGNGITTPLNMNRDRRLRENPPPSARSKSKAPLRYSNFGNSFSKVHLKWPKFPWLLLNTTFFPTKTSQWKGSKLTDGWRRFTWGWPHKEKKVMSPGIFHNNRNHCLYSACLFCGFSRIWQLCSRMPHSIIVGEFSPITHTNEK